MGPRLGSRKPKTTGMNLPPPPPGPFPSYADPFDPFAGIGVDADTNDLNKQVYIVHCQEQPEDDDLSDEEADAVRYKVLYKRRKNNGIAYSVTSKNPIIPPTETVSDLKVIFEVVTEYPTVSQYNEVSKYDWSPPPPPPPKSYRSGWDGYISGEQIPVPDGQKPKKIKKKAPTLQVTSLRGNTHITILSRAIIQALRHVVEYYPGQMLIGESITINEPFSILVHHWHELQKYREDRGPDVPREDICEKERSAHHHVGSLLDYVSTAIMPQIDEERIRHDRGRATWDMLWLLYKPGSDVILADKNKGRNKARNQFSWSRGFIVQSLRGGLVGSERKSYELTLRGLDYDGATIGWLEELVFISVFDGEMDIADLEVVPADLPGLVYEGVPMAEHIRRRGRLFYDLTTPACKHHSGKKLDFPYSQLDGLVMVDQKSYFKNEAAWKPELIANVSDTTAVVENCTCPVCTQKLDQIRTNKLPKFSDYEKIDPRKNDALTDHQYFLCPNKVNAFVFQTRQWEPLDVANLSEPRWKQDMIDTLVMDPARIKMLKALSKNFMRQDVDGNVSERKHIWSADFVQGKGSSQIFLLHGKPGVGKTYTAECIAEHTRRPLMTLTCADIGTDPEEVEQNLEEHFSTARDWGAILLIDEADIYMEKRSSTDLIRNSLVAGFLRALEIYEGILFLTTNRVGAFDDAFTSRIHVKLYYPPLKDNDRKQIWKSFTDKLARERKDTMRVTRDAKDYIEGKQIRSLELNGREIRNAFQTAVALAEFEAHKDEDGKILVEEHHIMQVADMSRDFKQYLDDLHRGDEAKRAERERERLDDFKGPEID